MMENGFEETYKDISGDDDFGFIEESDLLVLDNLDSISSSVEGEISLLDSLDLGDIGTIGSVKEREIEEVKFNNLFYIDFLGLNALTLLKEEFEVIKTVILMNLDKKKLNVFTKDMQHFNNYIRFLAFSNNNPVFKNNKDLQPEAINIADEFNTKVELLARLTEELTTQIDLDKESIRGKGTNTMDAITKDRATSEWLESVIASSKNITKSMKVMEVLIEEYRKKAEMTSILTKERAKDLVELYKTANYTYTQEEREILTLLNFPVAIIGNESMIKPPNIQSTYNESKQNTSGKSVTYKVEEKLLLKIYNAYTVKRSNIDFLANY